MDWLLRGDRLQVTSEPKIKVKSEGRHPHKLPIFCPRDGCNRITSNLDDPYLEKYGICQLCHTMFVADRVTPLIDVEFYRKRLTERGH